MQSPSATPAASRANGVNKALLGSEDGGGGVTASHPPTTSTDSNNNNNNNNSGAAPTHQLPKKHRDHHHHHHHHRVHVVISDHQFHPMHLRIPPRTVVVWENRDDSQHSLNERKGAWSSPVLDPNNHFALAFEQAGSFRYYCSFFPLMEASIQVADDDGDGDDADETGGRPGLVTGALDDLPREARFVARAQTKSFMLLAAAAAAAACSEGEAKHEMVEDCAGKSNRNDNRHDHHDHHDHHHHHHHHQNNTNNNFGMVESHGAPTTPDFVVREQQRREVAQRSADAARHRSAHAPGPQVAPLLSFDQNDGVVEEHDDDIINDDDVEDEVGVKASSYRATSSILVASLLERSSDTVGRRETMQRANNDDASDEDDDDDDKDSVASSPPSEATADTVESMWTRMAQLQVNLRAQDQSLERVLDEEAEFHAQARRRLRPLLKEAVGIDQVARSFLSKQQQRNRERPAYPPLRLSTQSVTVRLLNWRFHPDRLEIPTGCTVVFVTDPNCMTHCAVMCPLAPFESGLLHGGASFAHQFLRPGVYRVFDKIYTHMPTLEITVIDIEELVPTRHSPAPAQAALAEAPAPGVQPKSVGQLVRARHPGTEYGKVRHNELQDKANKTAVRTGHVVGDASPFPPTCSTSPVAAARRDSNSSDTDTATPCPRTQECQRQAKLSPVNERRLGLVSEDANVALTSRDNDDHYTSTPSRLGPPRSSSGERSRSSCCSGSPSASNLALGVPTSKTTTDARASSQTDHDYSDSEAATAERIARKVRLRQQAQARSVPVIPSSSYGESSDPDRGRGPLGKDGSSEAFPRTLYNVAYRAAAPTVTFGSFAVRPVRQGGAQRSSGQGVLSRATNGTSRPFALAKSSTTLSRSNHDQNGEDADDETNGTSDDEEQEEEEEEEEEEQEEGDQDSESGRFEQVRSAAQEPTTSRPAPVPEPSDSSKFLPGHATAANAVDNSTESTSPHRRVGPARAPMFGSTTVTMSRRAARKQRALAFQRAMAAAAAANSDESAAAAARHALSFGSDSATGTDSLVDRTVSSTSTVERMPGSDNDAPPPRISSSPQDALPHRQNNEKASGAASQGLAAARAGAGAGAARTTASSIALANSTLPKKRAKKRLSKKQRQRRQRQEEREHQSSRGAAAETQQRQAQPERGPQTKHPSQLDVIIDDTAAIVSASAALALSPQSRLRFQAASDDGTTAVHDDHRGEEDGEIARRSEGRNSSYPVTSAVAAAVLKVAAHRRVGPARAVFVDGGDDDDDRDDDNRSSSSIDDPFGKAIHAPTGTVSTSTSTASTELSPATLQAATTSVSLGWRHSRAEAKCHSYNIAARMIAQSRHDNNNGRHRLSSSTHGGGGVLLPAPQNRAFGTLGSFSQPVRLATTASLLGATLDDKTNNSGCKDQKRALAITTAAAAAAAANTTTTATNDSSAPDPKHSSDKDTLAAADLTPLTSSKPSLSPPTTCAQSSRTNGTSLRLETDDTVSHERGGGTLSQRSASSAGNERHRPSGRRSRKERQKSRLQLQEELIAAQVTTTPTATAAAAASVPERKANDVDSSGVSAQVQAHSDPRRPWQDGKPPPLPLPSAGGSRKKKKRRRRKKPKPGRPPHNETGGSTETAKPIVTLLPSEAAAASTEVGAAPAAPEHARPDLTTTETAEVPAPSPDNSPSVQTRLNVSTARKVEPRTVSAASATVKVRRSDAAAQQIASLLGLQPELTSTPPASPLKGAGQSEGDRAHRSELPGQERSAGGASVVGPGVAAASSFDSTAAGKPPHAGPSQGDDSQPSVGSCGGSSSNDNSNVRRELFARGKTSSPALPQAHAPSDRQEREGGRVGLDQHTEEGGDGQEQHAASFAAPHPVSSAHYPVQQQQHAFPVRSAPNDPRHHPQYAPPHTGGYHWQSMPQVPLSQHPHGPVPSMGNHTFPPPRPGYHQGGLWPNGHAPVQYFAQSTDFPPALPWHGGGHLYPPNPLHHASPADPRLPGQYAALHAHSSHHSSPLQHQFHRPMQSAQSAQLQTLAASRGDTSSGYGRREEEQQVQDEHSEEEEQEREQVAAAAAAAAAAAEGGGGGLPTKVKFDSSGETCPPDSVETDDVAEFESGEMDWSDCSWSSENDDADVPDSTFQDTADENIMYAEGSVCPARLSPTTVAQRERDLADERARAAAAVRRFLDSRLREP